MAPRLVIPDAHGYADQLTVGPRCDQPLTDDVVVTVGPRYRHEPASVLLTRARARELHAWLTTWLDHGWPGVPQLEGATTGDVIEAYREDARRALRTRDEERSQLMARLDAAIALIPPDQRDVDLADVARAQSRLWWQLTEQARHHEAQYRQLRDALSTIAHGVRVASGLQPVTAEGAVHLAQQALAATRPRTTPEHVPDAPVYDQLALDIA